MKIDCVFELEIRLPEEIKAALKNYYVKVLGPEGDRFAEERWLELTQTPGLVCYRVLANGENGGWVIVNNENSTIKEILLEEEWAARGLKTPVLDRILEIHKLVAAEVCKVDSVACTFLEEYGFRPTREFSEFGVPVMKMDLSAAVYLEKLSHLKQPSYQGKEVVSVEKVAEKQTEKDIKNSLKQLIDKLGGMERFVKQGQTVVIKPNLVSEHGLKNGVKKGGIVTDIRLIKALVDLLTPLAGKIIIAEGSSINRSETMKMFAHYGFNAIKDSYLGKVSLVDLNADECVEKDIPDGRRLEKRNIPKTLLDADVIINVPVLKLHFAAGASLSIKNLQGAIPPLEKYKVHFFGLWQNLINTYKIIMPDLIIIDGLVGQEDFGPVSGSPRKMDLLIAGTNPVAVDAVALNTMGLTPWDSPPVLMAHYEGMGPVTWESIEVKGLSVDDLSCSFKRPVINLESGKCFKVHDGNACPGCRGYLHFVLNKLRRPDPLHEGDQLIDRPFKKDVNIYIGPRSDASIDAEETTVFMGMCQRHQAGRGGTYLPGCPPHAEEIINGVFQFYKDVERPKYADQTEEAKLGELLNKIMESQGEDNHK
jgi:uncharacterized protein (DUF362 family)